MAGGLLASRRFFPCRGNARLTRAGHTPIIHGMAVVGITGSIASGKSTFRDLLARILPAETADADLIARNFLENNPAVRAGIKEQISPLAYRADGTADRAEIRRIIYSDPAAKRRIEALLHPLVRTAWTSAADLARRENRHLVVDIPLLFETDASPHFDFIITVACSPAVQCARLAARGLDPDIAQSIIRSQMPQDEKISRSSQVVWNDGDLESLRAQAEQFAGMVLSGTPPQ